MNVLENLLVTLMEECSEVAKAASKILRAGPDSTVPGRSTTNLQELQTELDDVQGVLMELRANGLDVVVRNPAAVVKKREKLRHYIGVSRQLGFVQGPFAVGEHGGLGAPSPIEDAAPHAHLATLAPLLLRSAKDFAEQYQCAPMPTVKKVIDALLNESNFTRDYLEEHSLKSLLAVLGQYPQHRDLYRELRRYVNSLPEAGEGVAKGSMAPVTCPRTGKRHSWKVTEMGAPERLRCSECGYIIYGPYDELPPELKNE